MWEIDVKLQIISFLRSMCLGVIFCILYDLFRAIRKNTASTIAEVFVEDLLFFLICTPIVFCFLLATTNGMLRAYVFLGIVLGFLLFRITLSRFTVKILDFLLKQIIKIFKALDKGLKVFCELVGRIFNKISLLTIKFFKKAKKVAKNS